MKGRLFKLAHLFDINHWCRLRGCPELDHILLPETGYFIPDVCVGFLYKTDSKICYLDTFITNPKAPAEERRKGVSITINFLRRRADILGFRFMVACTTAPSLRYILKEMGWTEESPGYFVIKVKRDY